MVMAMKIKMFQEGSDYKMAEERINQWLEENPRIKVIAIAQSESGDEAGKWSMTTTILYKSEP
jgi:hypothetical protein